MAIDNTVHKIQFAVQQYGLAENPSVFRVETFEEQTFE